MARIPESEIERLKLSVSLERLVESAGVVLKRHGKDRIGHCPFHDDKTPSLVVSPKTNLWHCLGACQAGGSVIDWVMRSEGVSFREAVERLREQTGEGVAEATVKPVVSAAASADDAALLRSVVDYYHATLRQSPEALAYLAKRGLEHPELIAHFRLGFANRTLGYGLPSMQVKAGAAQRGALQRVGIYRESGPEPFNGSWWCRCSMTRATGQKSTAARSASGCAKARRCTCTCRVRTAACSTKPAWSDRKKSFSAKHCSTR